MLKLPKFPTSSSPLVATRTTRSRDRLGIDRWRFASRPIAVGSHRAGACISAGTLSTLLGALHAELTAGSMPVDAFNAAASHVSVSGVDARFANPFEVLTTRDAVADRVRRCCAVSWSLHRERGIALAPLMAMAEKLLTELSEVQEQVAQETSGIRASARLLAVLPVMSPIMGAVVGCSPWGWLFGTRSGIVVAVLGLGMLAANHWAVALIARRAVG